MRKTKQASYVASLASKFPEIAKEWCYEKNNDLTPDTIFAGSHKDQYEMLHTQSLDYVADDISETLLNWERSND